MGGASSLYHEKQNENLKNAINQSAVIIRYLSANVSSIAASGGVYVQFDVPDIDGYTPLLGIYASNTVSTDVLPFIVSDVPQNGMIRLGIRNIGSQNKDNFSVRAYILYVASHDKEDL